MKIINSAISICVLILVLSSCEKDKLTQVCHSVPLTITISPTYNGEALVLNDSLYTDYLGRSFRVEMFKFYLSHLSIEHSSGEVIELDTLSLIDFSLSNYYYETVLPKGTYNTLHFGVGLDSLMNASDPSAVDFDSPLGISQNTYWSWASKYKFLMLEGRVDTSQLGIPQATFSYHTGFNSMYRTVHLGLGSINLTDEGLTIAINFALDSLLMGDGGSIDFVEQDAAHSELNIDIFETLSDNLSNSFYLN